MVRNLTGKHPKYYESILQLRDISPEVITFAEEEIIKTKLSVAKKVKLDNGFDYFLSDNRLTQQLGKKLQEKFGGKTQTTSSLWGEKQGKRIYRTTVLFRGVPFQKGDTVIYQGEPYQVKILSKDIFLQKTKTGEKLHLKYKDMDQIKLSS